MARRQPQHHEPDAAAEFAAVSAPVADAVTPEPGDAAASAPPAVPPPGAGGQKITVTRGEAGVVLATCECGAARAVTPADLGLRDLPPPPVPFAVASRYRVARRVTFSLDGCVQTLAAGEVVDAAGYSRDGIRRMVEAGVVLEPVG